MDWLNPDNPYVRGLGIDWLLNPDNLLPAYLAGALATVAAITLLFGNVYENKKIKDRGWMVIALMIISQLIHVSRSHYQAQIQEQASQNTKEIARAYIDPALNTLILVLRDAVREDASDYTRVSHQNTSWVSDQVTSLKEVSLPVLSFYDQKTASSLLLIFAKWEYDFLNHTDPTGVYVVHKNAEALLDMCEELRDHLHGMNSEDKSI